MFISTNNIKNNKKKKDKQVESDLFMGWKKGVRMSKNQDGQAVVHLI